MSPHLVHSTLSDKLDELARTSSWLRGLARHLDEKVNQASETLQAVEIPEPETAEETARRWLRTSTAPQIVDAILEEIVDRRAALVRTWLNQRLEVRSGRRGYANSQDRVPANGNGSNGHSIHVG